MHDPILGSLATVLTSPKLMGLIMLGIPIGMVLGALPGIGGKLGITLLIPFVFGMDAVSGAVFLVAMHAVVHTGGSIPSILIGVPGDGPTAATVCDGFPLARKGEAGRALGASLAASGVGGVIGALFLGVLAPVARPVVLAFGPPEFFFLAVLGITFIAAISGQSLVKGIIVGCLGLMLSFVGMDPQTGIERFTLGQLALWDGLDVTSAILAIFAVPEMIALAAQGNAASSISPESARYTFAELMDGVRDVFRHFGLTVRTSLIGAVIGMIPGLGGDVASWMCYGHAAQTSKTPELFGHGAIEGVIAPETANNSKEGGALLPTLFFGIPGSSGMAVMLGAFVMLGIQPGPMMALEHMDLVWILIWTLALSNVLAVVLFFLAGRWVGLIVFVRAGLLVPYVLILGMAGAHMSAGNWEILVVLAALGTFGYALKRCGWPRAPFAIGIVLGPIMEISLHQSLTIWGPLFFVRPITLVLAALTLASIVIAVQRARGPARVVYES
jgi:TctA family transporter